MLWTHLLTDQFCVRCQARLVEQIGAMLTSFTQRKTEEVSRTVAGLHSQLDSGRTAIGSSFAELNNLSTAATGHLQVSVSFGWLQHTIKCALFSLLPCGT